jgi:hypothetical protein
VPQARLPTEGEAMTRDLFVHVDELVKLINSTFYGLGDDTNYIVVPWQDNQAMESQSEGQNVPPEDSSDPKDPDPPKTTEEKETVKVEIKRKSNYIAKKNSIADGVIEYDAVLLPIGEWPYPTDADPNHTEIVDEETVAEYYHDPLSVKEGYFHIEHPEDPKEVSRDHAVGKYRITGVDERGLIGKIYTKDDLGDEITLSNFYFSHDTETGGLIKHRRIDFRNVVSAAQPRMPKARGKKSKAMPKESP